MPRQPALTKTAWKAVAILSLALSIGPAPAFAAWIYSFSSVTEGTYPKEQEGTALVDGTRWRIEYTKSPGGVTVMTAVIGSDAGDAVALNDELQTWFPLKSRFLLQIDSSLFTFGQEANEASNIRVSLVPVPPTGEGEARQWKLTFSYSIQTRVLDEKVRGRVWGEIQIWTDPSLVALPLPWKPLNLEVKKASRVGDAIGRALQGLSGVPRRTKTQVSRQLENGAVLTQTITREMGAPVETAVPAGSFTVPAAYRKQEPVVGVPGRT